MVEKLVELTMRCDAHRGRTFAWIKSGTRGTLRNHKDGLCIEFPGGFIAFVTPSGKYPCYRIVPALELLAEAAE